MSKKFSSIGDWLNDVGVRINHGVSDPSAGVLTIKEIFGPHDIGLDQRSVLRPQPRVKVAYKPGVTELWTAVWDIPEDVDLTAYGMT